MTSSTVPDLADNPAVSPSASASTSASSSASSDNSANAADDSNTPTLIIIFGETNAGKKFRPSDWCERLQGALRVLGDEAEEVADCVSVANYEGQKCIVVQNRLEEIRNEVYRFFMRFAEDNQLKVSTISQANWDSNRL